MRAARISPVSRSVAGAAGARSMDVVVAVAIVRSFGRCWD